MSDDSFEADKNARVTPRRTTRSVRKQTKEDLQVLEDQIADEVADKTNGASRNRAKAAPTSSGKGWISKKVPQKVVPTTGNTQAQI